MATLEMSVDAFSTRHHYHELWTDTYASATFTINRLPSVTTNNKSPYQLLYQRSPDYSVLRTVGCLCFPITPNAQRTKLQSVSTRCVFIGNSTMHKGYKCKDLSSGKITISRHVLFDENSFPFQSSSKATHKEGLTESHFRQLSPALLPSPTRLYTTLTGNPLPEDHDQSSSSTTPTNQYQSAEVEDINSERCPDNI